MKTRKLVKKALKSPELYSSAELAYFKTWLCLHKKLKTAKIKKVK